MNFTSGYNNSGDEKMVNVSRQKIYNSLLAIQKKYRTFDDLVLFVSYVPYQGIRLNVRIKQYARRQCWIENAVEVSDCLKKKSLFEIAEAIATETEIWIKNKEF